MTELQEGEVLISATYGTQRKFGDVKLSATQTQIVNTEEQSPADVRRAIWLTLKDEIDPLAVQIQAEHAGEDMDESDDAPESEAQVEEEDLSAQKEAQQSQSATSDDELDDMLEMLEEDE